jgi:nucleotide-binding universal stress UspA family protein
MENRDHQEPALEHARRLAQHGEATVVLAWLVPVVASSEHFFVQVQVEPGSSGARRKEEGEAFLAEAGQVFRAAGVDVEPQVLVTALPPDEALLDLASKQKADLIIMATLPQSAVGRFLFGSTGEKVRRRSSIPVLFVNPPQAKEGRQ